MDFTEVAERIRAARDLYEAKKLADLKKTLADVEGDDEVKLARAEDAKSATDSWWAATKEAEVAMERFLAPFGLARRDLTAVL